MENNYHIKGPRQSRALKVLLENSSIAVKDLGPRIGALNPRQVIMELRSQGFQMVIKTRRFAVEDVDGKTCYPGEYYIPLQFKSEIEEFLQKNTAPEVVATKAEKGQIQPHSNGGI